MKLSHFILLPYALASALVVPNNITFSITEQRVGQNQTVKPFCAGGLDYHPPTTWKAKREPKKDMSPKEQAENDAEIKRVADGGITFGRPRAWRVRPWLKPDQYSEDWFNADFELCRYSIPLTDVEGCVVFRGLEWLLFGVTHTATQISSTDGDVIFQSDWLQRGPTTIVMRALLVWTDILRDVRTQIEATNVLNLESQLKLAACYLDYAYQATAFLQALEAQGGDFNEENAVRCAMFDKMETLYLTYMQVSELMHGNDPAVRRMLDAKFPDHLPSYWHSKYEHPKPGEIIGEYVRRNDWPRLGEDSPFRQTQIAWTCIDDREQHKVYYPTKWDRWSREGKPTKQKWYSKERKANIKAMKDMRKKLDPLDPPTTWW